MYLAWRNMRRRCQNPRDPHYKNYGGRGITVCPEWSTFRQFLADVGERPKGNTLDRIDNDGNYEPGNVRWATRSEQQQNRRKKAGCTSRFVGVYFDRANGRWLARYRRKNLGRYDTEQEAAQAIRDHREAMQGNGIELTAG